eukprot:1405290-Rhodomonas_salina.1
MACEASLWVSDSLITCQTVAAVGGTTQVMVMSGVNVGSMTEAAPHDEAVSAVLRQAANRRQSVGDWEDDGAGLAHSAYTDRRATRRALLGSGAWH